MHTHAHLLTLMFYLPTLQTMAIATLALCYNNPSVFTGVVKIRKGQAVDLIMQSTNMESVEAIFAHYAEEVGGVFTLIGAHC